MLFRDYRITAKFPKEERYRLTSKIRRSAVFIPSNIAEGYGRKTTMDDIGCITFLMALFANWKHIYY